MSPPVAPLRAPMAHLAHLAHLHAEQAAGRFPRPSLRPPWGCADELPHGAAPRSVWCLGGVDPSGGAGLAADQRAVEAFPGLHACLLPIAWTAQSSEAVTHLHALEPAWIDAQLAALETDMPPAALKLGLLGGVAQVQAVARWIDRLRERHPALPVVVDPVLAATTGACFADAATRAAYVAELLPRATLLTPNRREAAVLLGRPEADAAGVPAQARALRALGAAAVLLTGGDAPEEAPGLALDWLDSAEACGWLAAPRQTVAGSHGSGCTFAASAAAALALGFVPADAGVLAKMATAQALRDGHRAGRGAGQVQAGPGFAADPGLLPALSWGEAAHFPGLQDRPAARAPIGLYALIDRPDRLGPVLAAGLRTVQLRIKAPPGAGADWADTLEAGLRQALADCAAVGARLVVNDHLALARRLGAPGLHLGQEDVLALGEDGRAALRDWMAGGGRLGLSSHSLWELARARALGPDHVACGPVWPTQTKAMPWRPQGLGNLQWWQRMAGRPVLAIGGILSLAQARAAAATGVDGVCLVRMLGEDPAATVAALQADAPPGA